MSKATKRKHVTKEVLDEFVLPDENKLIVKVLAGRGNNLHEVETPDKQQYLASMPTKFRKNVWIKRGDYVMVEPIEEGDKVKAEISNILYQEQIKYIQEEGKWPPEFKEAVKEKDTAMIPSDMLPPSDSEDDEKDNEEALICNPNRPRVQYYESSDSDSDENSDNGDNDCVDNDKGDDSSKVGNGENCVEKEDTGARNESGDSVQRT